MNKEKYINENQGLISKLALKYSQFDLSYDYEDLMQVGNMSMWKNLDKYDSKKSKISTYITTCMNNDMIKYIKKLRKHTGHLTINEGMLSKKSYEDEVYIDDIIQSYPTVVQKIINLKIDKVSNKEICNTVKRSKNFVKKELNKVKENL